MAPFEKQEGEGATEEFEWTVDNECQLFMAMADTKPAGINKHFHMLEIVDKFSGMIGKEISTTVIWKHLDTLYDMKMCDEIEGIPFPNDTKEFTLPDAEFGSLIKAKIKLPILGPAQEEVEERSASPVRIQSSTPRSTSRGAVSKESITPKVSKKELTDKPPKERKESEPSSSAIRPQTPIVDAPSSSKSLEKDTAKTDPRRDSKDSNASSKEGGSVKGGATSSSSSQKTPSKEFKGTKANRASIAGSEKSEESTKSSDDPGSNKRGTKRPLRGSLKPEEQPTPPGRRRRI